MIDIKFYIKIIVAIFTVAAVAYGVHLIEQQNFNEERNAYRQEITSIAFKRDKIAAERKEQQASDLFERASKKIAQESNETITKTKENIKNEEVTNFTDTF